MLAREVEQNVVHTEEPPPGKRNRAVQQHVVRTRELSLSLYCAATYYAMRTRTGSLLQVLRLPPLLREVSSVYSTINAKCPNPCS